MTYEDTLKNNLYTHYRAVAKQREILRKALVDNFNGILIDIVVTNKKLQERHKALFEKCNEEYKAKKINLSLSDYLKKHSNKKPFITLINAIKEDKTNFFQGMIKPFADKSFVEIAGNYDDKKIKQDFTEFSQQNIWIQNLCNTIKKDINNSSIKKILTEIASIGSYFKKFKAESKIAEIKDKLDNVIKVYKSSLNETLKTALELNNKEFPIVHKKTIKELNIAIEKIKKFSDKIKKIRDAEKRTKKLIEFGFDEEIVDILIQKNIFLKKGSFIDATNETFSQIKKASEITGPITTKVLKNVTEILKKVFQVYGKMTETTANSIINHFIIKKHDADIKRGKEDAFSSLGIAKTVANDLMKSKDSEKLLKQIKDLESFGFNKKAIIEIILGKNTTNPTAEEMLAKTEVTEKIFTRIKEAVKTGELEKDNLETTLLYDLKEKYSFTDKSQILKDLVRINDAAKKRVKKMAADLDNFSFAKASRDVLKKHHFFIDNNLSNKEIDELAKKALKARTSKTEGPEKYAKVLEEIGFNKSPYKNDYINELRKKFILKGAKSIKQDFYYWNIKNKDVRRVLQKEIGAKLQALSPAKTDWRKKFNAHAAILDLIDKLNREFAKELAEKKFPKKISPKILEYLEELGFNKEQINRVKDGKMFSSITPLKLAPPLPSKTKNRVRPK